MMRQMQTARPENCAPKRWRESESGIALMSVLVLTLIVTMLSVLVVGLVVAQTRPTLFTNKNARTISAAQAGIDSAIAQIRNASMTDGSGNTVGEIHDLPCVVNGSVEDSVGNTSYAAKIAYYKEDPEGKDGAWRSTNQLECGIKPNSYGLKAVPFYAVVTSVGTDADAKVMSDLADRTVEATYTFPLTTRTISGGKIQESNPSGITGSGSQFCLVASSASIGAKIRFQKDVIDGPCANKDELSLWSWRSDYMIHLSSTDLDGRVPLCISGRATGPTPVPMTLQVCSTLSTDPLGQRFSWDGVGTWKGQNAANTDYMNSFIVNQDGTVDENDEISVSSSSSNAKPWPLPAVGKGNASSETNQVVNQSLFGRCLDVTDQQINKAFQITYPCKQDPTGNERFTWNHKWYFAEPDADAGEVSVRTTIIARVENVTEYCLLTTSAKGLRSGEVGWGASLGQYTDHIFPRFATTSGSTGCSASTATWTRYGETGDSKTSWTLVDANGKCLSAAGPQIGTLKWESVVVQTCDGKDYQKWNVPDDPIEASIGNYEEKTGRTD